ncbi:hypothetical protein BEP19_15365 [Ammoniphilus oxalaticus]|uniref:Uncharacterized protein n=1 Tax=Ammoniphilus oxalaticus TaxID=66863 RepID=A0A419SD86_9BACL|nr:hypothetical protein [Ammoniphilus oxalaticus]RKD21055.1 hypothetical protein BEP19_15365 [Ammoniphilus oxalaticus]
MQGSIGTTTYMAVACQKCKSEQVEMNKRGFSLPTMFRTLGNMIGLMLFLLVFYYIGIKTDILVVKTIDGDLDDAPAAATMAIIKGIGILALPLSALLGFLGSSRLIKACKACGFKAMVPKAK